MRTLLLASAVSASALVLSASLGTASATTIGFTSQVVDYDVLEDGTYRIVATGAQGGTEPHRDGDNSVGGTGERVSADFNLTKNEVLQIAVGGKGGDGPSGIFDDGAGGGGGGTFVVGPGTGTSSILLVAGGGGGGGAGKNQNGLTPEGLQARDGVSTTSPGGNTRVNGGAAGSNGLGGGGANSDYYPEGGGGGGGFIGNGGGGGSQGNAGGNSFVNGLGGGGSGNQGGGGFGGGGGGGQVDEYGGGGGGGGYDGGGGGVGGTGGGSGGSFFGTGATNMLYAPIAMSDGNGSVIITELSSGLSSPAPVPEPASLALFGTALAGLGLIRRHPRG